MWVSDAGIRTEEQRLQRGPKYVTFIHAPPFFFLVGRAESVYRLPRGFRFDKAWCRRDRYSEVMTFLADAEEVLGIYGLRVPDLSIPAEHDFTR